MHTWLFFPCCVQEPGVLLGMQSWEDFTSRLVTTRRASTHSGQRPLGTSARGSHPIWDPGSSPGRHGFPGGQLTKWKAGGTKGCGLETAGTRRAGRRSARPGWVLFSGAALPASATLRLAPRAPGIPGLPDELPSASQAFCCPSVVAFACVLISGIH